MEVIAKVWVPAPSLYAIVHSDEADFYVKKVDNKQLSVVKP